MTATIPTTRKTVVTVADERIPFETEHGALLPKVELAYESWGALNVQRDNTVLIAHALTGNSHVIAHEPDDEPGWWESMVGPDKAIDTNRYHVLCINILGSCYGSTGPRSIDPLTDRRYNLRFPHITVRDIVAAQARLLDLLEIPTLHAVIGGSLGGMQALEWATMYPERVQRTIPVAASGRFSDQGIAFNEIQRRAIMLDPRWANGEYLDGDGPSTGLALARMVGIITYQSDELMSRRFARNPEARYAAWPEFLNRFDVEGYLHYQGDKLVKRFDANSYLYLTRAMDSHDLGRQRGSYEGAFRLIRARTLSVGIRSDVLFPAYQAREIAERVRAAGGHAEYVEIDSPNGHDAFLNDVNDLSRAVRDFLDS